MIILAFFMLVYLSGKACSSWIIDVKYTLHTLILYYFMSTWFWLFTSLNLGYTFSNMGIRYHQQICNLLLLSYKVLQLFVSSIICYSTYLTIGKAGDISLRNKFLSTNPQRYFLGLNTHIPINRVLLINVYIWCQRNCYTVV